MEYIHTTDNTTDKKRSYAISLEHYNGREAIVTVASLAWYGAFAGYPGNYDGYYMTAVEADALIERIKKSVAAANAGLDTDILPRAGLHPDAQWYLTIKRVRYCGDR